MKTYIKTAALIILAVLSSCGQRTSQGSVDKQHTREFPMMTPPAMMQDTGEIIEYMAMHYWDAFLAGPQKSDKIFLCDSLHVSGVLKGDLEQGFANYIYILENMPIKKAQKAVRQFAGRIEEHETADTNSNVFESFVDIAEKYMFDPNSPLRNEDLYSPFAEVLSQSNHMDTATKDRYAHVASMCRLNEAGTRAADFRFSDRKGREYTLHGINADHTLLFFSNPGCHSCLEIINTLKDDPAVSAMIAEKRLAVLNIYIDEDLKEWKEYMPIYPEEWYNGFDPDLVIRTDRTYNVRAIPSLYLLDADKTVLLKDATMERLLSAIHSL